MADLDSLPRRDLIDLARDLGALRPEIMTRGELIREIERGRSRQQRRQSRPPPTTWFGIARDLVASIVEQGLNLPDAAALIRGDAKLTEPPEPPAPVATVTLAQIYAAQGHPRKALQTLRELLVREPDHEAALELLAELETKQRPGAGPTPSPSSSEEWRPQDTEVPTAGASTHAGATQATDSQSASSTVAEVAPVSFLVKRGPQDYDLYWELSAGARARAERRFGQGEPAVKVVSLLPGLTGTERHEQWIDVDAETGHHPVRVESPSGVVRAALGWRAGDAFTALAVAATVTSSETGPEIVWQPRASYRPGAALERALADA